MNPEAPPNGMTEDLRAFQAKTIEDAQKLGKSTAVLLVGSRGAGLARPTSDLDLWLIGDKETLPPDQRKLYDERGELFVDRGDWNWNAHYKFHDERDLRKRLADWRDPWPWMLKRSVILLDDTGRAAQLKSEYELMPREIQERGLCRWLLTFREALIWMKGDGMNGATARLLAVSRCLEALCKVCCFADGVPPPYPKWLRLEAERTRVGMRLRDVLDVVLRETDNVTLGAEGRDFRTVSPIKELRELRDGRLARELNELGWSAPWIDDPMRWLWVLFHERDV